MRTNLVYTDSLNTSMSSAIESLLYNKVTRDLYVVWRHSPFSVYVFHGVPATVYGLLTQATSLGKAVMEQVVGVYGYTPYHKDALKFTWEPNAREPATFNLGNQFASSSTVQISTKPVGYNRFKAVFTVNGTAEITLEGDYPNNADVRGSFEAKAAALVTKGTVKLKSLVQHFD